MINFFRKIRKQMADDNHFLKYSRYAIGEIALVVIGILIALSINNWNEARKERDKEVNYLKNVQVDLLTELENNRRFSTLRLETSKTCSDLIHISYPKTIEDAVYYTNQYEQVFHWRTFVPSNNVFKELLSSGNLSLIKNEAIKNALLELDKMYIGISTVEYHMRREYEQFLYDVNVQNIAVIPLFDVSKPKLGFPNRLAIEDITQVQQKIIIEDAQRLHNNRIFKNGLKLAMMNNGNLAGLHENMGQYIDNFVALIDMEIKK